MCRFYLYTWFFKTIKIQNSFEGPLKWPKIDLVSLNLLDPILLYHRTRYELGIVLFGMSGG